MDSGLEDERSLEESSFVTDYVYEGLFGLARRLQTLILMEPNTIPNQDEIGVGIRNYLYSFKDNETLNLLKNIISQQIKLYIPNSNIFNIEIDSVTNKFSNNKKTVVCYFFIYDRTVPNITSKIALSFSKPDSYNEKIISEIYL